MSCYDLSAVIAKRETIAARIDRLVREAIEDGRYRTATEFWSPKGCGLSRSYPENLRRRLAADPDASLSMVTAAKIARALGLPVTAITGELAPPPALDIYPNRAWAVESARNLQLSEAAIERILVEDFGRDLPRIAWFMRIYGESLRLGPAAAGQR